MAADQAVFISQGNIDDDHLQHLRTGSVNWTIHSKAQPGDTVVFYFKKPTSALVAWGYVETPPKRKKDRHWGRGGFSWNADIRDVQLIEPRITLDRLRENFPDWAWLNTPRSGPRVPNNVAPKLLAMVREKTRHNAIVSESESSAPPARVRHEVTRVLRDSARARELKDRYNCHCQVCREQIVAPQGGPYAEVHHLRPLGKEHRGHDNCDNMLVLCPNCHARFDLLVLAVEPRSNFLHEYTASGVVAHGYLHFRDGHELAHGNVRYHWKRFQHATGYKSP